MFAGYSEYIIACKGRGGVKTPGYRDNFETTPLPALAILLFFTVTSGSCDSLRRFNICIVMDVFSLFISYDASKVWDALSSLANQFGGGVLRSFRCYLVSIGITMGGACSALSPLFSWCNDPVMIREKPIYWYLE